MTVDSPVHWQYPAVVTDWPTGIYDGDTYRFDVDRGLRDWLRGAPFRLHGVDAPSIKGDERPEGLAARDRVRELLEPPAEIVVSPVGGDPERYGRYLGDVIFRPYPPAEDPEQWHDLAEVLLDEGHAVPYN